MIRTLLASLVVMILAATIGLVACGGSDGDDGGPGVCIESCTADAECDAVAIAGEWKCIANLCELDLEVECSPDGDDAPDCDGKILGLVPDCVDGICANACTIDNDCDSLSPKCSTTVGVCMVCRDDDDCNDGKKCLNNRGCSECGEDAHCTDELTRCLDNGTCGCAADADCQAANLGQTCREDGLCECEGAGDCNGTKVHTNTAWQCNAI